MFKATCCTAGIVKGLVEHGDHRRHFGSYLALPWHLEVAERNGLITVADKVTLTASGRQYYDEKQLADLPDGRAYMWPREDSFWHTAQAQQKDGNQ